MITGNNSYGFSVIIFLFLIPTSFLLFCMKRFHKCYGIELFSMNISLKILFVFQILLIIVEIIIFNYGIKKNSYILVKNGRTNSFQAAI